MFDKYTTFSLAKKDVEVMDSDLIKTAAVKLPDGINYDPDFLYLKVRGVSAGEYFGANKNLDYFPEEELKKAYKTFLTAHAFKNHENKDIANAIGDVLAAEWDDEMKGVMLTIRIDRRIAPSIVRGFEKGFMTDVSMGCRVDHVICSYCGQKAKTQREYCDHLRTMKGKIFDNGVKVYEINISPKFHDISAVLNGAEKVAKVAGIYIHNNKVAFKDSSKQIEKISNIDFDLVPELEKVASFAGDDEIFETSKLSKKAWHEKISEIKKEIQGKVMQISQSGFASDRADESGESRAIFKLMGEKYWDEKKCSEIAAKIQDVARKHSIGATEAFCQFLDVLDFAGIELSPKEFAAVSRPFSGIGNVGAGKVSGDFAGSPLKFMQSVDNSVESARTPGLGFGTVLSTLRQNVMPNMDSIAPNIVGSDNPVVRTKIIIAKLRKPVADQSGTEAHGDMMRAVAPLMAQRSMFPMHFIPRISKTASENPNFEEFSQLFIEDAKTVSDVEKIAQAILYSSYQSRREQNIFSDRYFAGLEKFASYIEGESMDNILSEYSVEKTAANKKHPYPIKAHLAAIPMVYGYSGLQRARINKGEDVGVVNRYVAENPDNAAIIQAIVAPKVYSQGAKVADVVMDKTKKAVNKAVDFSNKYYVKTANELYGKDLFKDKDFDKFISDEYSPVQISALKTATVLYYNGDQSKADEMLEKTALKSEDIDHYLQSASDYLKIKIDETLNKTASLSDNFSEIVKKSSAEMLTNLSLKLAYDKFGR